MLQTTLAIMIKDKKIFLGEKKRGFAKGVLNGVGGKQEGSESIENCMIRETKEEIGVDILSMGKIGVLHFFYENKSDWDQSVHLYDVKTWEGEIIETEEIKPLWFDLDKIPYDKMWADDIYWLPRILNGEEYVEYNFWFDGENGKVSKYEKII